jgi:trehalose 6-phosphate phosphatase
MISLFSPAGKKALTRLFHSQTLCAFDYDGTLSPYFNDPDDVYTPDDIKARLVALRRLVPVAVVSGRSVKSLKPRLGFKPDYLVGNHGVDGLAASRKWLPKARQISVDWAKHLDQCRREKLLPPGVWLENKAFSLTFHYRGARNLVLARRRIEAAIKGLKPVPRVVRGKYVYNLVPPGLPHKGTATREIQRVARAKNSFFMGDDITDEDAFRGAPANWITVRVGKSSRSAARYYIPSFDDVPRLLEMLLDVLEMKRVQGHR